MADRVDETHHRLLDWTTGQAASERLAAQVLRFDGFADIDPSHPLGGRDGGKDAVCQKDDRSWAMAVYFPRGQQPLRAIAKKLKEDCQVAHKAGFNSVVFVTNQELSLSDRNKFITSSKPVELRIYHLERVASIVDAPGMEEVRRQYLSIETHGNREFEGELGHADKSHGFNDFMVRNLGNLVRLNVWFRDDPAFQVRAIDHFSGEWFALLAHHPTAPALERGEFMPASGFGYRIERNKDAPESALSRYRGIWRLRGHFVIVASMGPSLGTMGLIAIGIRAVAAEHAQRSA